MADALKSVGEYPSRNDDRPDDGYERHSHNFLKSRLVPTIRLTVAYEGTDFSGWQVQPGRRTVQEEIETAIHRLTGETVRVQCAGRTDAGVHAIGQVAGFTSQAGLPPEKWRPALQTQLPDDIVIVDSELAPDDFHATYATVSKRYRYLIHNSRVTPPFLRRYVYRVGVPLNVSAMHAAAQVLLGRQDFRCFETQWPNKASSVRTILDLSVRRMSIWPGWSVQPTADPSDDGDFVVLEVEADGFLYNMVRSITGTLLRVGHGVWTTADVTRIVAQGERRNAGETAPPQGLYLVQVRY